MSKRRTLQRRAMVACAAAIALLALLLDVTSRPGGGLVVPHLALVLPALLVAWLVRRPVPAASAAEPDPAPDSESALAPTLSPGCEQIPVIAAEVDARHRCCWASRALADWLRLPREQIEGLPADDLFGAGPAAALRAAVARALEGEVVRLRCAVASLASGERWLQVEVAPHRDTAGTVTSCFVLALEVTPEQLELEEARHSERRLRLIMDQIPVTVSYIDADMRYRYINRAQEQWLGKPEAEVVGRAVHEVVGAQVFSDIEPNLRKALCGEPVQLERERTDRDGQRVWHSGRHVPDVSDDGTVVGLYTVFFDITQRAQTEQALRQREHELRTAKEAAENASRAKSEFLANMSHEIRTPMNGVLGLTELLLETPLDPQQRPFVEIVRTSGEALLQIINDILDFSKIEAGKLETEMLDYDLYQAVEDVVQLLAPRAHAKQLELACRIDERLPVAVRGDPYRLRQILTNLLGNAVKFTPAGEVVVDVRMQDPGAMRFSVRDTGAGIDADIRERLFQPFEQADGSTTRRFGGTGLGLAICRSLVELMGGQIGVDSVPGSGSTFWFTLPLREASNLPAVPTPAALAGLHVLVVDDNPTNREILEHHVASGGMRCETAVDGVDALERLRRAAAEGHPFDIAVVDMKMPRLDGIEVATAVRADPALAGLRTVLVTSLHSPAEVSRAREVGISAYLSKPVRRHELFRALAQTAGEAVAEPRQPQARGAEARFRAHVLLAEDNGVNQVVARNMLKAMGCTFEIVPNGVEAVAACERGGFDIVLMDCQMPELDGYDATRAIRAIEAGRPGSARLPIVALTANALVGDAEACRAAGMDDHLAKPYTRKQLARMLSRWLPPGHVEHAPDDPVAAAPPAGFGDADALDEGVLANIRALDEDGSVMTEVIQMYLDEAPAHIQGLKTALSAGDTARLAKVAHAMKSASFNVGAMRLGETCRELERIGKAGDLAAAPKLVAAIEALLARAVPLMHAEMARCSQTVSP